MPSGTSDVKLIVGVGVEELRTDLKASSAAIGDASREWGNSFGRAKEGLGGLTGALTHYRRELSGERRMASVFARDIADMGIASKSAASEITMLVGAFAFGGGLGVGIHLIKMAVGGLNEIAEAAAKAKAELKKFVAEINKPIDDLTRQIDEMIFKMRGMGDIEIKYLRDLSPLLREQANLKQQILALDKGRAAPAAAPFGAGAKSAMPTTEFVAKDTEKLKDLTDRYNAVTAAIKKLNDEQKRGTGVERQKKEIEDAEKEEKVEQDHTIRMLQLRAELLSGVEKLQADFEAEAEKIRSNKDLTEEQKQAEINVRLLKLQQDQVAKSSELAQKEYEAKKPWLDQQWKDIEARDKKLVDEALFVWEHRNDIEGTLADIGTARRLRQLQKAMDDQLDLERKRHDVGVISDEEYEARKTNIAKNAAEQRRAIVAQTSMFMPGINSLVSSWEQAFDAILTGTMNWSNLMRNIMWALASAIGDVVKSFVSTWLRGILIDLVGGSITSQAAQTAATKVGTVARIPSEASEAAVLAGQSVAAIPVVGWAMAGPVAAAVFADMMSYLIASAAGGWDVPAGGPFPTILHGKEMVLNQGIADPLRTMLASGGFGRPITAAVNVSTVDARGFETMIRSPANRSALLRLFRDAMADGRF